MWPLAAICAQTESCHDLACAGQRPVACAIVARRTDPLGVLVLLSDSAFVPACSVKPRPVG